MTEGLKTLDKVFYDLRQIKESFNEQLTAEDEERQEAIKKELERLAKIDKLLEEYEIDDLLELELALSDYYHRYDDVETRMVNINE